MADFSYLIGVDTGGTFTDAVAIDNRNNVYLAKNPSTPHDLSLGVMRSLEILAEAAGVSLAELLAKTRKLAHGTTATVNAMVQRRGARTGLITTRGFRDHLLIMKAGRGVGVPDAEKVWFSRAAKPEPLVPYPLVEEVTERVDYAGRVVTPLDEDDARRAVRELLNKEVEAIAVSLLWSFKNPSHEQRIRDLVREMAPHLPVSLGSDLVPVMGEYERTTTAVINAYLGPVLARYVHGLERALGENGFRLPVLLMQSDGGLVPGSAAPERAVTTLLSGLAAGVLGARQIGQAVGCENVITIDMGGTSFEVGMVYRGQPLIERFPLTPRLAPFTARWRIAAPAIDITAIGAGGGSIARVEEGVLKVGPLSAGADPGPACYDRGGSEPTVTDAFLVLGYLNPDNFLGGRMAVDRAKAIRAIEEKIARPLGIDFVAAADGISRVVLHQMADLIRKVTIERGHDPREFVMVAFGGCGPIHAGVLGADLGVPKVLVPGSGLATATSAFGLVISDLKSTVALTRTLGEPIDPGAVRRNLGEVAQRARGDLRKWGVSDEDILCLTSIDMRFKRQVHETNVPVPSDISTERDLEMIYRRFEERYESLYGRGTAHREAGIEMVTFRAEAVGLIAKPRLSRPAGSAATAKPEPVTRREVFFDGRPFPGVPIFEGDRLPPGCRLDGPAVVEYMGNTVVVHPGQSVTVDEHLNLVFELGEAEAQ